MVEVLVLHLAPLLLAKRAKGRVIGPILFHFKCMKVIYQPEQLVLFVVEIPVVFYHKRFRSGQTLLPELIIVHALFEALKNQFHQQIGGAHGLSTHGCFDRKLAMT